MGKGVKSESQGAPFRSLPIPTMLVRDERVAWINDALAELAGERAEDLVDRPLEELVSHGDLPALRRALTPGARCRVRTHLRSGSQEVALDMLVSPAEGGHWLTGANVTALEVAEGTIARLGELYVSRGGRAMLDRQTFLGVSRELFQSLGWTVAILSVQHDGLVLDHLLASEDGDDVVLRHARNLLGELIAYEHVPVIAECVRTRSGTFAEDTPQAAARLLTGRGMEAAEVEELTRAMQRMGYQRRVCAPVLVGDRVRHVIMGFGPRLTERDFIAVQLFAAQFAASELLGELSEDLIRQQRLAALGQLSMLVAHEVRNPLAVIFQAARQIRRRAEGVEQVGELLDILDEEAERLKNLVDDLVHFAGPLQPRLQPVDLSEVVRWCAIGLRDDASSAVDERVQTDVTTDAALVRGDPLLLRQALTHLLNHAVEHAGAGCRVWLRSEQAGELVRLVVGGEGPPHRGREADELFEPCFNTKAPGSGLSLPVVRRLIEDQEGRIEVERDADHCAFSVYLPPA
ncbi:MAG: ATP-binding protein [Myxococcota bacterium]